jgi:hypothetical protein
MSQSNFVLQAKLDYSEVSLNEHFNVTHIHELLIGNISMTNDIVSSQKQKIWFMLNISKKRVLFNFIIFKEKILL